MRLKKLNRMKFLREQRGKVCKEYLCREFWILSDQEEEDFDIPETFRMLVRI